jgi:ketosteroid isomerase-like protein
MPSIEDANTATVRAMYQAFQSGDHTALEALFADDIELEVFGPPEIPFVGKHRGHEGLKAFFETVAHHTERPDADHVPEVQELVAQGDKVVAIGVDRIRGKATARAYDGWWVHVIELRDGKVARVREYIDTAAAREMFAD